MYTLREINNNTRFIETNQQIGESYSFYDRGRMNDDAKFLNYLNFYDVRNYTMEEIDELEVKGFIIGEKSLRLLYCDLEYYIMTESGKTFESIKFTTRV
jgi:hypothetical protein